MKREYILVLIIFFLLSGPGPSIYLLNKYTVTFFPVITLFIVAYLLREEWLHFDLNTLKKKETVLWMSKGLQLCVFSHAICTLLLGERNIITDSLISSYAIMPVFAVVVGPILEEIVYRKILFHHLFGKINIIAAAVISSTIFGMAHLSVERFLAYFLVGLSLCYVYKKSNSLTVPVLAHIALNLISIMVKTLKG